MKFSLGTRMSVRRKSYFLSDMNYIFLLHRGASYTDLSDGELIQARCVEVQP